MLHPCRILVPALVLAMVLVLGSAPAPAANNAAQQRQQLQQQQQQMMQRMAQQQQQMIQRARQQQQQMMHMIQQAQQQAQRQMQQVQRQQQRAAQVAGRNMARQAQQMARNAQKMPRPVLQNVVAEYEFIVADDGLVRSMAILAQELDENGRPRKLDTEEKKKLKGSTPEERRLVGYKAEMEDLQPGDEVIVTLSRYRPRKQTSPGKETDKEKESSKSSDKSTAKEGDNEKAKDKENDKEKSKDDKEADAEEQASMEKLTHLKDWKPQGKLHGIILETDTNGSRRMTLAIQEQQVAMVKPGQNPNQATNKNAKPPHTSIDPSALQGTFVVIIKRGAGAGGTGAGFGSAVKK